MKTTINNPPQGPQTAAEREFAAVMLTYYRQAGERAAWALAERMSDADRAGMVSMARAALESLPTRH